MPKVTMVMTERDVANTAKIRDLTNARSNAHAVSIALSLTCFVVDALQKGQQLLLRGPDGEVERVFMVELENVTNHATDARE